MIILELYCYVKNQCCRHREHTWFFLHFSMFRKSIHQQLKKNKLYDNNTVWLLVLNFNFFLLSTCYLQSLMQLNTTKRFKECWYTIFTILLLNIFVFRFVDDELCSGSLDVDDNNRGQSMSKRSKATKKKSSNSKHSSDHTIAEESSETVSPTHHQGKHAIRKKKNSHLIFFPSNFQKTYFLYICVN